MQTPEGKVKADIKKLLKERGIWFFMPVQNGMGVVGIPDFICCAGGAFLSIEAKAPGKADNLSPNQQRVRGEILQHGGFHLVVDDVLALEQFLEGKDFRWESRAIM
jgi:hypothetical protein